MDRRQKRLVATIIAVSLSLVGAFAGVIVWSASHRGESEAKASSAATSPVPSSEAIPSHSATSLPSQVDGYASEFRPTSAQKERAVRAVKAAAQWSQSETEQERFKRLSSEFSNPMTLRSRSLPGRNCTAASIMRVSPWTPLAMPASLRMTARP